MVDSCFQENDPERKKIEYINRVAKQWIKIDCDSHFSKERCQQFKTLAVKYDKAHKKLRDKVDSCSDFIEGGALHKARIFQYNQCMIITENYCKSMIRKFYGKFIILEKH